MDGFRPMTRFHSPCVTSYFPIWYGREILTVKPGIASRFTMS
jgi:hypothetical protein